MEMEGINKTKLKIIITIAVLSKSSIFRFIFGIFNEIYIFFRANWNLLSGKKVFIKRDHYVPQMILRNFAIDSDKKKGLVFQYERGKNLPTEESISKKVACKPGYYLTKNKFTKKMDNIADDWLNSFLESRCRIIFTRFLSDSGEIQINNAELNFLASFVSNLYTRTPAFRAQLKHVICYLLKTGRINVKELGNKKRLSQILSGKDFEQDRMNSHKVGFCVDITGIDNHLIIGGALVADKITEQIFKKLVSIYEAPDDIEFIINDNPVRIVNDEKNLTWPDGWDLINKDTLIFIPISRKRCLVFSGESNKFRNIPIFKADKKFVERVNFYTIYYANDYVYSGEMDADLQNNFNITKKLHKFS
jgi:hypothetical protein